MHTPLKLLAGLILLTITSVRATETINTAADNAKIDFIALIQQMDAVARTLRDATYIFHKQEYADGKQQPAERIAVKFRAPDDIYMKWLGPTHAGREVLFRGTANDGQLRVSMGRWLPTLNLSPDGDLALRGNRHSIEQLPFPAITANFMRSAQLLAADTTLQAHVRVLDAPHQALHVDEAARCYEITLPKAQQPLLYAEKTQLCISLRTQLPVLIQSWDREDGALRLVENYAYENVQINVGLTDRDFDADNPNYSF